MRERFTADEWELLKYLPFQIFALVAGADGKIDKREVAKLEDQLEEWAILRDSLHRQIILDLTNEPSHDKYVDASMDRAAVLEAAPQVRKLLEEKLSDKEREQFLQSMFANAMEVAEASGDKARFGKGENVSEAENYVLRLLIDIYGIPIGREDDES